MCREAAGSLRCCVLQGILALASRIFWRFASFLPTDGRDRRRGSMRLEHVLGVACLHHTLSSDASGHCFGGPCLGGSSLIVFCWHYATTRVCNRVIWARSCCSTGSVCDRLFRLVVGVAAFGEVTSSAVETPAPCPQAILAVGFVVASVLLPRSCHRRHSGCFHARVLDFVDVVRSCCYCGYPWHC